VTGAEDPTDGEVAAVIERYARFARDEAPGRSEIYGRWAADVASDRALSRVVARIPASRRQPPLVFAVARMLGAEAALDGFSQWAPQHADALVNEASRRSLQTNEPLRCAALLPALATIDGPIALIEVGASAGLCMIPDRYSYRYGSVRLDPVGGESTVVLDAVLTGAPPLHMPHIAWRAGVDLAPLDASDDADRRFLTALVWPGEEGRADRIAAALDLAAPMHLEIQRADATAPAVLAEMVARAPAGTRPVVTTPGVMPHIDRAGRARLIAAIRDSGATWISIDPAWMHPNEEGWTTADASFLLTLDGDPVAAVDPLGARVEWRR
jgi:hypothetical protein